MGNQGSVAASPFDDGHVTTGLLPPPRPSDDEPNSSSAATTAATSTSSSREEELAEKGAPTALELRAARRELGKPRRLEDDYDVISTQQLGRCVGGGYAVRAKDEH